MDIGFLADKGGVGKSTLAFHVATRLRQLGHDVALYDLDRQGTSADWDRRDEPYFPSYKLNGLPRPAEYQTRVWDTPAHPSVKLQERLGEILDISAVVASPDLAGQRLAASLARSIEQQGGSVGIVFNLFPPTSKEGYLAIDAARERGLPCYGTVVRAYRCYQTAQWDGCAVCDFAYASADKAWADICALTDEILARGAGR